MKNAKNELLQLLAGLLMLVAGMFILAQKVMVTSTFTSFGFMIADFRFGNGLIMLPFIIGIMWMFGSGGSFLSKLFTIASVVFIIVAIVMTTNISLVRMTLYEWILILVLIFGGAGMLSRVLFSKQNDIKTDKDVKEIENKANSTMNRIEKQVPNDFNKPKFNSVEDELENMKKNM